MPRIRHFRAKNFRKLKEFEWLPAPGFNCIIGPGDSGKSTILDAIDLALGARRSYSFIDSDFFQSDTSVPIEISITIGDLPDELKSIETYGNFLRGFDQGAGIIHDEPEGNCEPVLTIKLEVGEDLDPDWRLYSERAEAEGYEKRLIWKHRELLAAACLGVASQHHLSWGNRSILNKFSEQSLDVSSTFAQISRDARNAFAGHQPDNVSEVLNKVKEVANALSVDCGNPQAQIDIKGITLSSGAISLHDENNTPLRQLGTGSSRLLISGLHKAATSAGILIVDEAEYGLEPFRISRLLNELGSKTPDPEKQVFITTHSPYVLRELKADQLHVLRAFSVPQIPSHVSYRLIAGDTQQAALRACAESFLSKRVIVCEGKTEIGLIRGMDLYWQGMGHGGIYANGVSCADGGGSTLFSRAHVFSALGYSTAIFKDSDIPVAHQEPTAAAINAGIPVYEWGNGCAIEDILFSSCPANLIVPILNIAIERKGNDSVNAVIKNKSSGSYGLQECLYQFNDSMRPVLAAAAKSKSWYKDIEPAEILGRDVIAPNYSNFSTAFTNVIGQVFQFAYSEFTS